MTALRALSLGILLLFLLSPILYYVNSLVEKPQILVLKDVSASLDLAGGAGTKRDQLEGLGKTAGEKFASAGYELLPYEFSRGLEKDPSTTLLSPALAELAEKHDFSRIEGVLLLSDGWLRDESLESVRQLGAPFYAVSDTLRPTNPDLAVTAVTANRHAYRGEPTLLRADLNSANYSGPATVNLMLGGKKVAAQTVRIQAGTPQSVDFTQTFAQTGFYPFSIELSAPGIAERSQNNNAHPGAIEVLNDRDKVAVISDTPAWDNKFLIDAIAADNRREVSHFRITGGRILSGDKPVPALPESGLAALVIVNNGGLRLSGAVLNQVLQSHRRGVGVLYQGLPVDELAGILPLKRSNITTAYQGFLELTPAAAAWPMLGFDASELQQIPPLDYFYVTATKGAEVLATANNPQRSPAIAASQVGGRVIAMAFLNLWKWQLQSKSGGYRQLIGDSVTWLANRGGSGYEAIHQNSYFLGEPIQIRLRAEDGIRAQRLDLNPELTVRDAGGKEVWRDFLTNSGGEYAASLELDKAGAYSFQIEDKVSGEKSGGRFNLANSSFESRDLDFNLPLLSWLASDTGGKLLTPAALETFQPLPAQPRRSEQRRDIPLYRKWYVLSLFILAFCLELFFRRRWGLL